MSRDVMKSFTNFKNGTSIIQVSRCRRRWVLAAPDVGLPAAVAQRRQSSERCRPFQKAPIKRFAALQKVQEMKEDGTAAIFRDAHLTPEGFCMLILVPAEGSEQMKGAASVLALVPGGVNPVDPVLPRFPQDPEPAHLPQPGGPLRAHQPASPHGGGEEAQAQLLMHHHQVLLLQQHPPWLRAGLQSSDGNDEEHLTLPPEEPRCL